MAEVAGTIVGVISLSLQLYDKLSEYTNGVKDARKKAEQITRELDTLVDLLEHLETATSRMDPTTPIALVKAIIQQCALSIESIRTKVGDDTPSTSSSRFSTQSRKVIKRLAYPFKESDIKY
ncbi:uncharacterized protein J4E92_007470 [Alternaria infectoria]|uniref:uncharacterized protein n=1 Tax=Alternaria infectoria TaxID=45303 RepID=UPI00221FC570|nr:uncharacterized protein J4E92_007470 [Alternaria infectoria]KAI4924389.1 hypothetical protein J4E92_007470 [Alternaria infectoria]